MTTMMISLTHSSQDDTLKVSESVLFVPNIFVFFSSFVVCTNCIN